MSFVKSLKNGENLEVLDSKYREIENNYRELFAVKRDSEMLNDPHLHLINLNEVSLDRVQAPYNLYQPGNQTYSLEDFETRFHRFSCNQLRDINWNNLVVAGGAVLDSLNVDKHESKGDIDMFIYGLDEQEANNKLIEIYNTIKRNNPHTTICFRSANTVTIVSEYPFRHMQIILRLYKSPAEILMGFDVDSCSVAYDGKDVWATPRCYYSLVTRVNKIDMTRRSPSYEFRLHKYAKRGFAVWIPNFKPNDINPNIYLKRLHKAEGLARLLVLNKMDTPAKINAFKSSLREYMLRPKKREREDLFLKKLSQIYADADCLDELEDNYGTLDCDYSTVYLPWGPRWNASSCERIMLNKDMVLNSSEYDPNKKYPTHPCFIGTMSKVIQNCSKFIFVPEEVMNEEELREYRDNYVYGDLTWKTVNPGSQKIGSFHPIDNDEWANGVYEDKDLNELFQMIINGNLSGVQQYIDNDSDINQKDCSDRTPLHLATLYNQPLIVELLLNNGAMLSYKMNDGRSAFHLAVEQGNFELVKIIFEYGSTLPLSLDEVESDSEEEDVFDNLKNIIEFKNKQFEKQLENNLVDYKLDKALERDDYFDPNEEEWDYKYRPMYLAVMFNYPKIVEYLYKNDIMITKKEFTLAMIQENIPMIELLIKYGVKMSYDDNIKNILLNSKSPALTRFFLSNINDVIGSSWNQYTLLSSGLQQYCSTSNEKLFAYLEYLVKNGASFYIDDPPKNFKQPLYTVITSNRLNIFKLCFDYQPKLINHIFKEGNRKFMYYTPLDKIRNLLNKENGNLEKCENIKKTQKKPVTYIENETPTLKYIYAIESTINTHNNNILKYETLETYLISKGGKPLTAVTDVVEYLNNPLVYVDNYASTTKMRNQKGYYLIGGNNYKQVFNSDDYQKIFSDVWDGKWPSVDFNPLAKSRKYTLFDICVIKNHPDLLEKLIDMYLGIENEEEEEDEYIPKVKNNYLAVISGDSYADTETMDEKVFDYKFWRVVIKEKAWWAVPIILNKIENLKVFRTEALIYKLVEAEEVDIVDLLIKKGILYANKKDDQRMTLKKRHNGSMISLMRHAITHNCLKIIIYLNKHGRDTWLNTFGVSHLIPDHFNIYEYSVLSVLRSTCKNKLKLIKVLTKLRPQLFDYVDDNGRSLLMFKMEEDVFAYLVKHVDVNLVTKTNGNNVLFYITKPEMLKYLPSNNYNVQNNFGQTPHMWYLEHNYHKMYDAIKSYCDDKLTDFIGNNIYHYLAKYRGEQHESGVENCFGQTPSDYTRNYVKKNKSIFNTKGTGAMDSFVMLPPHDDKETIKNLCIINDVPYSKGNGYYAHTKTEDVSDKKDMVIYDKSKNKYIVGSHSCRKELSLDLNGKIKITKKDVPTNYVLFIQSTSPSRKIPANTQTLVKVLVKESTKIEQRDYFDYNKVTSVYSRL